MKEDRGLFWLLFFIGIALAIVYAIVVMMVQF